MRHVYYIYLQIWVIYEVNVGKYSEWNIWVSLASARAQATAPPRLDSKMCTWFQVLTINYPGKPELIVFKIVNMYTYIYMIIYVTNIQFYYYVYISMCNIDIYK